MAGSAAELFIRITADTSAAMNALRGVGDRLDAFGANAMRVGGIMSDSITAPLVGVATAAVKTAADFQGSMNLLQVTASASGDQMAALRDKAIALGNDLTLPATSANDAAQAMLELVKGGLSVNDTLAASKGVLQLSAAANIDNARAAEIAANALNAFGLRGQEAGHVSDLLAAAANASSVEITQVADSFKMASAVYSSFQGPVVGARNAMDDLTTAIAVLGNAGIKGSDAGTSLKQMMLQLSGPSDKAKDAMKALFIQAETGALSMGTLEKAMGTAKERTAALNAAAAQTGISLKGSGDIAYDASGRMRSLNEIVDLVAKGTAKMNDEQRNAYLTQIFGADATRAIIALMNAQSQGAKDLGRDWDAMHQAVTKQNAAADLAGARMTGLNGAIQGLKSQLETLMLTAGTPALDILEKGVRAVSDVVPKLTAAWRGLSPEMQSAILAFAGVMAAAGPVIAGLGLMATVLAALLSPIGLVAVGIAALAAAYAANIGDIRGKTEAAIGGAADFIREKWPQIKEMLQTGWDAIVPVAESVFNTLKDVVSTAVDTIGEIVGRVVDFVKDHWPQVRDTAVEVFNTVRDAVSQAIDAISERVNSVVDFVKEHWPQVRDTAESIFNAVREAVHTALEFINSEVARVSAFFSENWAQVQQAAENVWNFILTVVSATLSSLQSMFSGIISVLSALWREFGETVVNIARLGWENVKAVIDGVITIILGIIKVAISVLTGDWQGAWDGINQILQGAWDIIKSIVENGIQIIIELIKGIGKGVGDLSGMLLQVGRDLIQGLINGVEAMADAAKNAAMGVVKDAVGAVKSFLHIESPSRVMAIEVGEPISMGIAVGIRSGASDVTDAMQSVGDDIVASGKAIYSSLASIATQSGTLRTALTASNAEIRAASAELIELRTQFALTPTSAKAAREALSSQIGVLEQHRSSLIQNRQALTQLLREQEVGTSALEGATRAWASLNEEMDLVSQYGTKAVSAILAMQKALTNLNDPAAGQSAIRAIMTLALKARDEGVENWQELARALVDAFSSALEEGIDEETRAGRIKAAFERLGEFQQTIDIKVNLSTDNLSAAIDKAMAGFEVSERLGSRFSGLFSGLDKAIEDGGTANIKKLGQQIALLNNEFMKILPPEMAAQAQAELRAALQSVVENPTEETRQRLEATAARWGTLVDVFPKGFKKWAPELQDTFLQLKALFESGTIDFEAFQVRTAAVAQTYTKDWDLLPLSVQAAISTIAMQLANGTLNETEYERQHAALLASVKGGWDALPLSVQQSMDTLRLQLANHEIDLKTFNERTGALLSISAKEWAAYPPAIQNAMMGMAQRLTNGEMSAQKFYDTVSGINKLLPNDFNNMSQAAQAAILGVVQQWLAGALTFEQATDRIKTALDSLSANAQKNAKNVVSAIEQISYAVEKSVSISGIPGFQQVTNTYNAGGIPGLFKFDIGASQPGFNFANAAASAAYGGNIAAAIYDYERGLGKGAGQQSPITKFASGGVIREPITGVGLRTGGRYLLGEAGPETVTPGVGKPSGSQITINQHFHAANMQPTDVARAQRHALWQAGFDLSAGVGG